MNRQEYEQLDIHEMERRVAAALIDLVDDPKQQHRITLKLLATRSKLPLHRVSSLAPDGGTSSDAGSGQGTDAGAP